MADTIWKTITGYEGLYEVSNEGEIARVDKGFRLLKLRIDRKGYMRVNLSKNGELKTIRVHTLVAREFIPNPYGLTEINHIDEDKTNNAVCNLEWCTRQYNVVHGTRTERQRQKVSKPVIGYSPSRTVRFNSGSEAAFAMGLRSPSSLFACCRGERKTAGGMKWRYADD